MFLHKYRRTLSAATNRTTLLAVVRLSLRARRRSRHTLLYNIFYYIIIVVCLLYNNDNNNMYDDSFIGPKNKRPSGKKQYEKTWLNGVIKADATRPAAVALVAKSSSPHAFALSAISTPPPHPPRTSRDSLATRFSFFYWLRVNQRL